jgi:hypothetical protein
VTETSVSDFNFDPVALFYRGERTSQFLQLLITPDFFYANLLFETKTMQQKSLLLHTPVMQKQAFFWLAMFFLPALPGRMGGQTNALRQGAFLQQI